jgi:hypothetical protein
MNDKKAGIDSSKLKSYSEKALLPFVDLLYQYKEDIHPYWEALSKGMNGAVQALSNSASVNNSKAERIVASWFERGHSWVNLSHDKFKTIDKNAFVSFVHGEALKHPGLAFASSYFAGLIAGRVTRFSTDLRKQTEVVEEKKTPPIH